MKIRTVKKVIKEKLAKEIEKSSHERLPTPSTNFCLAA